MVFDVTDADKKTSPRFMGLIPEPTTFALAAKAVASQKQKCLAIMQDIVVSFNMTFAGNFDDDCGHRLTKGLMLTAPGKTCSIRR